MSTATYAKYCLAESLSQVRAQVARLEKFPSPNAVHDGRVALRRTRTLIDAYKPILDASTAAAETSFRRLNRLLGEARDCYSAKNVLRRILHKHGSPPRVVSLVQILERREKKALSEARRSARQVPFSMLPLSKALDHASNAPECPKSYAKWLRKRLLKRLKKLSKEIDAVRSQWSPALHRARIELKKLRYLAETLSRRPNGTNRLIKIAKKAQSKLGKIHDVTWLVQQSPLRSRKSRLLRSSLVKESADLYQSYEKKLRRLPSKLKERIVPLA